MKTPIGRQSGLLIAALFWLPSPYLLRAQGPVDFSGSWRQNLSRSVPQSNSGRSRELIIRQADRSLRVRVNSKSGGTEHSLSLEYQIGGPELVYKGLDGDEFHTKVRWDGTRLLFDTVEHERGKEIESQQIWTLEQDGGVLRDTKLGGKKGETAKSIAIFEKSAVP